MIVLYIFLLFGIISLIFWQYARVVIKRIITLRKIRRISNERGIKFKCINRFYAFSKNSRNEFDFLLRVGSTVIPVKFYSSLDPRSIAIIEPSGKICIRQRVYEPLSRTERKALRVVGRTKNIPSMRIKKNLFSKKYTCFPVFLNEPSFCSTTYIEKTGAKVDIYDSKALVGGCHWFDIKTFVSLLEIYSDRS